MPFKSRTVMEQRAEFSELALSSEFNFSELCRRFKITRRTGYKWLRRYNYEGVDGLKDRSRRPVRSPGKLSDDIERKIISIREHNPEWGAKKIHRILLNRSIDAPARSTISRVLKRNGLISDQRSEKATKFTRFEYPYPNDLWQIDFKGYFKLLTKGRCHPLTITDDHSRFNIGLFACKNESFGLVQEHLSDVFLKYGLPEKILTDNGPPWGSGGRPTAVSSRSFTKLEVWLLKQNVQVIHGRPYHPQTQGKEERFHRTLKDELLKYENFKNLEHCQLKFDRWRYKYNCQRPHEAIDFEFPVSRYKPSPRLLDKSQPETYGSSDQVRKVHDGGYIFFKGNEYRVGKAFIGERMAIKRLKQKNQYQVYFRNQFIRNLNL